MSWIFNTVHRLQRAWDEMMMRPKGLALLLLIILFFAVLLAALCFHTLIALGCIVIVAGIVFPVYLPQWKAGLSFLLVLCGVVLLLHEQMWFQGFFQNTAITILKKQGKDYGEKLETYNRTMAIMTAESESNRQEMVKLIADTKRQQQDIETQGQKLRATEADVRQILKQTMARQDSITTNITAFTTRLTDSQSGTPASRAKYLMTTRKFEHFKLGNTNGLLVVQVDDNNIICLIRLESAAIPNAVDIEVPNANVVPGWGCAVKC